MLRVCAAACALDVLQVLHDTCCVCVLLLARLTLWAPASEGVERGGRGDLRIRFGKVEINFRLIFVFSVHLGKLLWREKNKALASL